jgi:hypothetical protein
VISSVELIGRKRRLGGGRRQVLWRHGVETKIKEEFGSGRAFGLCEMGFVEMCRGLAYLHATRSNINIGNVGTGGCVPKEDTVVGMFIQFSGRQSIAAGQDKGAKSFKMGNVRVYTGPCLKRGLVDRQVPETILEMDSMDEGVAPEFGM